jgi:hypothetical protein
MSPPCAPLDCMDPGPKPWFPTPTNPPLSKPEPPHTSFVKTEPPQLGFRFLAQNAPLVHRWIVCIQDPNSGLPHPNQPHTVQTRALVVQFFILAPYPGAPFDQAPPPPQPQITPPQPGLPNYYPCTGRLPKPSHESPVSFLISFLGSSPYFRFLYIHLFTFYYLQMYIHYYSHSIHNIWFPFRGVRD